MPEAWALWLLGLAAAAEQRADDAAEHFEQCRQLSIDPRYPFILGRALVGLGCLDNDEDAWEQAHQGLAVLADFGDRLGAVEGRWRLSRAWPWHVTIPIRRCDCWALPTGFTSTRGWCVSPCADRAERHITAARAQLEPDVAEAFWAEGTQLTLDGAVA